MTNLRLSLNPGFAAQATSPSDLPWTSREFAEGRYPGSVLLPGGLAETNQTTFTLPWQKPGGLTRCGWFRDAGSPATSVLSAHRGRYTCYFLSVMSVRLILSRLVP
jgi:hypothetical protein